MFLIACYKVRIFALPLLHGNSIENHIIQIRQDGIHRTRFNMNASAPDCFYQRPNLPRCKRELFSMQHVLILSKNIIAK